MLHAGSAVEAAGWVRSIWRPKSEWSVGYLSLLAIGMVVSFCIGFVVSTYLVHLLFDHFGPEGEEAPSYLVLVGLLIGCLWPAGWAYFLGSRRGRYFERQNSTRLGRLRSIRDDARAVDRLPHRVIELILREEPRRFLGGGWSIRRRLRRVLAESRPGVVVMIDGPKGDVGFWARAGAPAFEPIRISELDRHEELLLRECDACLPECEAGDEGGDSGWEMQGREVGGRIGELLGVLVYLLFVGYMIYSAVTHPLSCTTYVVGFVAVCCIPWLLRKFVLRRKAWVVPGGIVLSEHPLWRVRRRVWYLRREDTALVLDFEKDRGFALWNGKLVTTPFHELIPLAWLSRGATPTDEQVLCLVGWDSEWA